MENLCLTKMTKSKSRIYVDKGNRHRYRMIENPRYLKQEGTRRSTSTITKFKYELELNIEASGNNEAGEMVAKEFFRVSLYSIGDEETSRMLFVLDRDKLGLYGKELVPGLTRYLEKLVTRPGYYH